MKKLLFIVMITLSLLSCSTMEKVDETTKIPYGITERINNNQVDTVQIIMENDFHYIIKEKEIKQVYDISNNYLSDASVILWFVFLFLGIFIGVSISS